MKGLIFFCALAFGICVAATAGASPAWELLPSSLGLDAETTLLIVKGLREYQKICSEQEKPLLNQAIKAINEQKESDEESERKAFLEFISITRKALAIRTDDFQFQLSLFATLDGLSMRSSRLQLFREEEELKELKILLGRSLVKKFPKEPRAHSALGDALMPGIEAVKEFKECSRLDPSIALCDRLAKQTRERYQRPYCRHPDIQTGIAIGPLRTEDIEEIVFGPSGETLINFSRSSAEKLSRFTSANIGKDEPVLLGKKVLVIPRIQSPILDGRIELTGAGESLRVLCSKISRRTLPQDLLPVH